MRHEQNAEVGQSSQGISAPEGKRLYAIGDIHGRVDLLQQLLARCEADFASADNGDQDNEFSDLPETDPQFIFLGDYVDRGPASAAVLQTLMDFSLQFPDTVFLRGNHEEAMVDFLADPDEMEGWIDWGGQQTLESYGLTDIENRSPESLRSELAEKLPEDHLDFLISLENLYISGDYIFVHAGLRAGIPLGKQRQRDLLWIRRDFYEANPKSWGNRCIVHGHTPRDKPENIRWRINVDTGAFNTGRLTAVVLEGQDRRFISTSR